MTEQTRTVIKRRSLLRSTTLVSSMTMLSRVLGFVRDIIIAHLFGASAAVDAFLVAFKIPNFMRRLFAEGAFSQAFVPILSEYQETKTPAEEKLFLSHIAGNLFSVLFLVTAIAVVATPIIVMIFAPGFLHDPTRYQLASYMLRITFPYLLFISMTAMAGAVLNTYDSFGVPAFTPVLLNVCLIVAALYFSPYFKQPVEALAWGVFIAGIVQLLFQLPFLYQKGLLVRPRINWRDKGVGRVLKLMLPALFGVSVAQINLLMDTLFASFLPVGSVSWLYFSDRLMNFPLGVFGVGIATVILPHLSRKAADKDDHAYSASLDWGIRLILLISIPAAIGLLILAGPLIATLFKNGQFSSHDVLMARKSLMAFALGVPAFMLIKIFASGFYARQDIKTPVKVGVIALVTNMLLNLILIKPFAHMGLALATTIAAYVNAGCLFYLLNRQGYFHRQKAWLRFGLQLLVASTALILWLLWQGGDMTQWLNWRISTRVIHLLYLVSTSMALFFASLWLTGIRYKDLISR